MSETRYAVITDAETGEAMRLIANERWRQIEEEGWTREHDDEHVNEELALAGAAYATAGRPVGFELWPWKGEGKPLEGDETYWKPGDHKRNVVKAAALLTAELERIIRKERGNGTSANRQ